MLKVKCVFKYTFNNQYSVRPWRVFVGVSGCFVVSSKDFHLAHRALVTIVGSWVAVEPNGTGLPSTFNPPRLGAVLPSPRRALNSRL
jgi:hypothetical protein